MELENREVTLNVRDLEEFCRKIGTEQQMLFGFYKEKAGYEGWTNYESYVTYRHFCDEESILTKWSTKAKNLLNESVYRTYGGNMTPYEAARMSLAEEMKDHYINKVEEKWTLEPLAKTLLTSAYETVNWYELVDVLMEDIRPSLAAEPQLPQSNVVPLLPSSTNPKRKRRSLTQKVNEAHYE